MRPTKSRPEPIPGPKRKKLTPKRRAEIWELAGRRCECGEPVQLKGTVFDHRQPFWMRPDLDDWPNLRPLCKACNDAKTYGKGGDISRIAKTKRQAKMSLDVAHEPSKRPIKSRGFRKAAAVGQGALPAAYLRALAKRPVKRSDDDTRKLSGGKLPGKGQGRKLRSRNSFRK